MNIKRQAVNEIIRILQQELEKVKYEIGRNKVNHKLFIDQQTKLKRKRTELSKVINELTGRSKLYE